MADVTGGAGLVDELDEEEAKLFSDEGDTPPEEPVIGDPPAEEPAPVEEPTAEAPPAEQQADEEDEDERPLEGDINGNKGRFVRHGAFHRQRMRAQEFKEKYEKAEAERQEMQASMARLAERLNIMQEAFQQPQQQPQQGMPQQQGAREVPDPEVDPFGHMRYLQQRIEELTQVTEGVGSRIESQDNYSTARTAFIADANAFQQQKPDFMDAYSHLMQSRDRELQRIGRNDPRERQAIISQEEFLIVQEALRTGRSPAELFYSLAEDRGYRYEPPAAPEPEAAPAPAAAPATAQQPSAMEKVRQLSENTQATKSLSSASGSGGPKQLTPEVLANMSEEEFERYFSAMTKDQRRQYFGG